MSSSGGSWGSGTDDSFNYEEWLREYLEIVLYDLTMYTEDENLKVKELGFDNKANTTAHHTDQFDIANSESYNDTEMLVVRRGQQFNMKIKFNRPYDKTKDDLRLIFEFGKDKLPSEGSRVDLILSDEDPPLQWGAEITKQEGPWLTIAVTTPPTCAVAKWTLKIDAVKQKDKDKDKDKTTLLRYTHKDPIYILFNPWCKDDEVYQEHDKEEYILNESGLLYRGSWNRFSSCPWNYGQFSEWVLPCAMLLLDKKPFMKDSSRGDAVMVARKISSLVNSFDNDGVLMGSWAEKFPDGTPPTAWTGSPKILEQYYKTEIPVKYGQCWVFSGVVTSICRALGIPARSVTNFESAHDKDGSVTIDQYFDKDLSKIAWRNRDSVWNFHVWNEVWMRRDDLPEDFRGPGWQVIDATPQETSDGKYCLGPFPTAAVKSGDVYLSYDGRFVFAEVNADKVSWMTDANGKTKVVYIETQSIGKYISTKDPHSKERREDITHMYKFKEGSTDERNAVRRANLYSKTGKVVYKVKKGDVTSEIVFDDDTFLGDPIKLGMKIKNTSTSTRTVSGHVRILSTLYTGRVLCELQKRTIKNTVLQANEEITVDLEVSVQEYMPKVDLDSLSLKMIYGFEVDETNQIVKKGDVRRLRKPHLTIKAPKDGTVGTEFETEVSFVNPLPVALTRCELEVEGPGLQAAATLKQKEDVKAKGTFTAKLKFTPAKPGEKEIIVSFNSAQLNAVDGSAFMKISKK